MSWQENQETQRSIEPKTDIRKPVAGLLLSTESETISGDTKQPTAHLQIR